MMIHFSQTGTKEGLPARSRSGFSRAIPESLRGKPRTRGAASTGERQGPDYDPVVPIALPTSLKVVLAFEPSVAMAAMHTTMMRANITAYSTAVGPSSRLRNSTTQRPRVVMVLFFLGSTKG